MRARAWTWAIVASCCLLAWPSDSFGQASAVADKLFHQAVDYMKAGDFASACPLLERSYQMDPKDGTLFTLANCRDHEGKLVAAVGHYRAYLRAFAAMTGVTRQNHAERAATAKAQIEAIEPVLPKVKFVWETPPPPESKIIVDDVEFRAATLDVLLPLDPGTHRIVVQLPGEPDRTRTVTLAKGGSTIIDLTPAKPTAVDVSHVVTQNGTGAEKKPRPIAVRKHDPAKIAGFVGVGVGAAGLVVGTITGAMAISEKQTLHAHCNDSYFCDDEGMEAVDRLHTAGNASTASFIVGGLLAGVGVTLVLVSTRTPEAVGANVRVRTAFSPGMANFALEGTF